jgi:dipeptidyl aminopeptidase/acylaminoacyl peptidase
MKKILFILVLSATGFNTFSQSAITPEDIADLKMVTFNKISPDGSKIIYGLTAPVDPFKKNDNTKQHIYLYDVKTGQSTAFITQGNVGAVHFRPNHNSITFLTRRDGDKSNAIYEIKFTGGEAQKIFEYEASISGYDWHPDGNKLVFTSKGKSDKPKTKLPYEPEVYEENLSNAHAYIARLDGSDPKMIILNGNVGHLAWSHNGNKIAMSVSPSSLVDDHYTSQRVKIINAANGKLEGEIDHKAKLGKFAWSPGDGQIAFIGGADQHDPKDARLLITGNKGGKPEILAEDFKGSFDDFAWLDDETIMFLASEGVYASLGTINMKGKMKMQIEKGDIAFTSFSMSDNGLIALSGNTAAHPNELFILQPKSDKPKRLTDSNPWLKDRLTGSQEVYTYKAQNGFKIEGILIKPANYKAGKKYPLITVVHGGPESHYNHGWLTYYSMPGQLAAGNGYVVFYPNYRGSTGRGLKFAKSSQGDPAGKEFDDVIDGIDALIDDGLVDGKKVGVTGGSYGGYATGWMATRHTDRFAAGVMFVGISDNISKWGTSDIPEEMYLVHSRKRIWEDYKFVLERSPIYYAGQTKTPLLIMAGKNDTRVDPGQSYELYRHIKTRTETPVRLVLYPGEGHGNRKATARYDYNIRMMRWFDNYLKGDGKSIPSNVVEPEK